jgi:hypothetical protein
VALRRLAVVASVVGLRLSVRAYPSGLAIRDAGQVALLGRLRKLLHPSLSWRAEVPLPLEGDLRAWDAAIGAASWTVYVDAETRILDAQALERRLAVKQRDTGTDRVILLLADTRTNRLILRSLGAPVLSSSIPGPADHRSPPRWARSRGEWRSPAVAATLLDMRALATSPRGHVVGGDR